MRAERGVPRKGRTGIRHAINKGPLLSGLGCERRMACMEMGRMDQGF